MHVEAELLQSPILSSRKTNNPTSPHPRVPTHPCPRAPRPHSSSSAGFGIAAISLNSHYCSKERPRSHQEAEGLLLLLLVRHWEESRKR